IGCGISYYLIMAMFTTHSRGGILGLAGVVGAQILVFMPHKWFFKLLFLGLITALVLCPFAGFVLDESAHNRVVFWGMANEVFKRNPVFGIGFGMFWEVTATSRAAHNAFVKCYTELGFVGYWFWFGLIQLGLLGAQRARVAIKKNKSPDARWLYRLAGQTIVAMVGFCASAYFLSRTFVFPLFFLMAMLGVVPAIARRHLPPTHPLFYDKRRDVWRNVTIGTTISIIYIYISIILLNKAFY
ncbi:MAG: O-antigen ligase family protein, partial [Verrucomicrobia bacterium]|nr:O-antigen ligase family protein [Verrucomicrobiota bacterium]